MSGGDSGGTTAAEAGSEASGSKSRPPFDAAPVARPRDARVGRFAGPRILVVGCGDVGVRLVALLHDRFRVHAATHSVHRLPALRALGATPHLVDLDDPASLWRLASIAPTVVHLAPPPGHGPADGRTANLCAALRGVRRLIYISTSGVYGDCNGEWVGETRPVAPQTDRARRRVDAERRLRLWALASGAVVSILRVPGIYAGDRLPIGRLESGTPALRPSEDVYTNHIHADDLARVIVHAIDHGAPQRVYHAVDDSAMLLGEWFDLLADAHGMARPERVSRAELGTRVSSNRLSFMAESRRLTNDRLHDELGVRLAFPTVRDGVRGQASER